MDIPLRMAFQTVSSRNVTAISNFSATPGGRISNSNPASDNKAARLGELDASISDGMATNSTHNVILSEAKNLGQFCEIKRPEIFRFAQHDSGIYLKPQPRLTEQNVRLWIR
jgi:hypothetical protein